MHCTLLCTRSITFRDIFRRNILQSALISQRQAHITINMRRSSRIREGLDTPVKVEEKHSMNGSGKRKKSTKALISPPAKRPKKEEIKQEDIEVPLNDITTSKIPMKDPAALLKDRKLKAYASTASKSPFPNFPHPTPAEAKLAHSILASLHGARTRPETVVASTERAGCGDSPSVLDALVRTILSQNTSDVNSSRAKRSMDVVYGGSDRWDAIVAGEEAKLEEAIRCGGLSKTKSRVIMSILTATKERYGEYSLDHLFSVSNDEAMQELVSLKGVGPKTASCVLLFCLRRDSFAVDTHVHRLSGLLGWRPPKATREETFLHLESRIPDEDKYGLHILMVSHGKKCPECRAGGQNAGKCELRKAFKNPGVKKAGGKYVLDEQQDNTLDSDL
jgi:endonuclease-3